MIKTQILGSIALTTVLALSTIGCSSSSSSSEDAGITAEQKTATLTTYASIATKNYGQAYTDAVALQTAIQAFTDAPTTTTLEAAKTAWKTARESYGTTEAFRLSDGPIDGEETFSSSFGAPEGQLNAWPLNESMIDYTRVDSDTGAKSTGNIIDGTGEFASFTSPDGTETINLGEDGAGTVDITTINTAMLKEFTQVDGDANVATGYHAVEFLLWGQDQDYTDMLADNVTNGATEAGARPLEDYTTDTNKERRIAFINAAADLIVEDLALMTEAWDASDDSYRTAFLGSGTNAIDTTDALTNIFKGLGVFIKSELANERMAVAVQDPSEEDEHSCFSDNTHRDVVLNYNGFKNLLKGTYLDASQGDSFYSLASTETQGKIDTLIAALDAKVAAIDAAAATEHFDRQIHDGSANKQNIIDTYREMRDLGDLMVDVAGDFDIDLTIDDVTDGEESDQGQS